MAQKDYYKTLEVPRTATEQDIKSSYRRLARKYHPDVNQANTHATDRFKEINEAYEVLGDADKRRKYDQFGPDWEKYDKAGFGSTTSGGAGFNYDFNNPQGGFGDIFDSIFGNASARPRSTTPGPGPRSSTANDFGFGRSTSTRPQRGEDFEQQIDVTLEEAYQGSTRQLQIQSTEPCTYCNGSGVRNGARCSVCGGVGYTPRTKRMEVRIPVGVDEGTKVKVTGEGAPGMSGGQRGDLLLKVRMLPHPAYVRKGTDLHTTASIPLYTALLGGEIIITSLKGSKFALNIPPETQNGKAFRLTNQGMPVLNTPAQFGDMYVKVEVMLPANLSEKEKQLYQQLKDLRPN